MGEMGESRAALRGISPASTSIRTEEICAAAFPEERAGAALAHTASGSLLRIPAEAHSRAAPLVAHSRDWHSPLQRFPWESRARFSTCAGHPGLLSERRSVITLHPAALTKVALSKRPSRPTRSEPASSSCFAFELKRWGRWRNQDSAPATMALRVERQER